MRDHQAWGNRMSWFDWDQRRLSGHTTPHPSVGDELLVDMQSGKVARFEFAKVEPCYNPHDMWFATLKDVGYLS